MVAGKRTAELLHKQHKHELHRQSHSDVYRITDLFHHSKHSNETTPNPSPKLKHHQRPTHAHTIDLSEHVMASRSHGHGSHQHKGSKCDLSKTHDGQKHKKQPNDLHPSSSMDSVLQKSPESCHKPHKWSWLGFRSCAVHQLQVVKLWIRTRISRVILVVLQYTFAHDVCYDLSVGADQDHRSFGWLMLNSIFSARVKDIVYFSANESSFLHLFFMFL